VLDPLALSRGPNRVFIFRSSYSDENRPSFRNVVFSSYSEFRAIDTVKELSDSG
jgi:hypothetical protein